ncbi:nitroreductase family deazaflavin-dependent oxidoreductase [Nocardia sp. NPDC059240]|uniref:nitroreductase family deazaflavin-dependent oxidoreductase n=1 Tax=Nocardia sp. NPDC059240 TaxID=3346786 RepID=UPI003687A76F
MPRNVESAVAAGASKISTLLGPRMMRRLARFNKRVTNPIQLQWATRIANYSVLEHVGRKSGKHYRTPVMVFVDNDRMSVLVNYGTNSDWVRNIRAAGSAGVIHRRKHYRWVDVQLVPTDSANLPETVRATGTPDHHALTGTLTPVHGPHA